MEYEFRSRLGYPDCYNDFKVYNEKAEAYNNGEIDQASKNPVFIYDGDLITHYCVACKRRVTGEGYSIHFGGHHDYDSLGYHYFHRKCYDENPEVIQIEERPEEIEESHKKGLKGLTEAYLACKDLMEEALDSGAVYHPLGFDIIYADQDTNPESQKIHCYLPSSAERRFNFELPLTRDMSKEEIETATLTGCENLSKVWYETAQEWILDEEHCQGMDLSQYSVMRERGLSFYPNAKLVQIYAGEDQWSSSEEHEVAGLVVYAMKEEAYSMNEGVESKLFEQASGTTASKAYTICKVSLIGYGSGKVKADPDQFVDVCESLGFENYGEYVQVGEVEVANFEELHKEYAAKILDTFNLKVEDVRVEMKHSGVNSLSYQVEYLCPKQSCQLVFRVGIALESADSIKSQIESLCDGE